MTNIVIRENECCSEVFFNHCVMSCLVSDDHSRVKLENSENDYINASLVMVEEAQRAYILSQVTVWYTGNVKVTVGINVVLKNVIYLHRGL